MLTWPVYFLLVTYLCQGTCPFCVPLLFVPQVCLCCFQYAIMVTVRHYFYISYTVWTKATKSNINTLTKWSKYVLILLLCCYTCIIRLIECLSMNFQKKLNINYNEK